MSKTLKLNLKKRKKGKTEKKKTQWLAKIGSRLAARGSGSQARTLVTLILSTFETTKWANKRKYENFVSVAL